MDFQVERGVPLPVNGRNAKYPFRALAPGDSFLVPDGAANFATVRRTAQMFAARNKITVTCRKVDGGLRVWRAA